MKYLQDTTSAALCSVRYLHKIQRISCYHEYKQIESNLKGKAIKKGRFKNALIPDLNQRSVDNRIHRASIDASTALGAVVGDPVDITCFNDSTNRAGIDTGPAADTVFSDFQSHNRSPNSLRVQLLRLP
jgi:hypothetical protein